MSKAERFAAQASIEEVAERCLETLRKWSTLQRDLGTGGSRATRKANRLADAQRVYLKALEASAEGRRRLEAFLDEDDPGVQEWAAAHVLFWNESRARSILERLQSTADFPFSFSAEMTLQEFDAKRLRL